MSHRNASRDDRARELAAAVGWISLGIGIPLTLAPGRSAVFLGWEGRPRLARAIGAADLVVGPALLPSWKRVRAISNAIIAGIYSRVLTTETHQRGRAVGGVVGMSVLTLTDYFLARRLWTAEEGSPDVGW